MLRQNNGNETEARLVDWRGAQSATERLAGHILRFGGFESIDPSHPLGGPDGLKDVVCKKDGLIWIGAFYFPTRPRTFATVRKKFRDDLAGVEANNAAGMAFVTNQRLSVEQRNELEDVATQGNVIIDIFHLEALISLLDTPLGYGVRLEFLGIEMTASEQASLFQNMHQEQETRSVELHRKLNELEKAVESAKLGRSITDELEALKKSVSSFYPDPVMSMLYGSFHRLGRKQELTYQQLSDMVNEMDRLAKVLPVLSEQLPQIISLVASLAVNANPYERLLHPYTLSKSPSEKFREGVEVLERLAKIRFESEEDAQKPIKAKKS